MTPENELHIRSNSRRKSVFGNMVMLMAAKRVKFPEVSAWVDELSVLDMRDFPRRDDDYADGLKYGE